MSALFAIKTCSGIATILLNKSATGYTAHIGGTEANGMRLTAQIKAGSIVADHLTSAIRQAAVNGLSAAYNVSTQRARPHPLTAFSDAVALRLVVDTGTGREATGSDLIAVDLGTNAARPLPGALLAALAFLAAQIINANVRRRCNARRRTTGARSRLYCGAWIRIAWIWQASRVAYPSPILFQALLLSQIRDAFLPETTCADRCRWTRVWETVCVVALPHSTAGNAFELVNVIYALLLIARWRHRLREATRAVEGMDRT